MRRSARPRKLDRGDVLFSRREVRAIGRLERHAAARASGAAWSSWNTSSSIGPAGASASSTSCCTTAAARTAAGSCPGLLDVEKLRRARLRCEPRGARKPGPRGGRGLNTGPMRGWSRPGKNGASPLKTGLPSAQVAPKTHIWAARPWRQRRNRRSHAAEKANARCAVRSATWATARASRRWPSPTSRRCGCSNYSEATIATREHHLREFIKWCAERGLARPTEITKPTLERYQRWLYHYRQKNGQPLTFRTQHGRLVPVRAFFKWLCRQNHLLSNPASDLELPRAEKRLPRHVLTAAEAERVLALPDLAEPDRTARPRHAGGVLLDRDAPDGTARA